MGLTANWTLETDRKIDVSSIQSQHPYINSNQQLSEVLKALNRLRRFESLTAYFDGQSWRIVGKVASIIRDVEIEASTTYMEKNLTVLGNSFRGFVDTAATRKKLVRKLAEQLGTRGFPKGNIELNTEKDDGTTVLYKVYVEEGEPCLVRQVQWDFSVNDDIDHEIKTGVICDRSLIGNQVSELEQELRNEGYTQVKTEVKDWSYDSRTNTATYRVAGSLGRRIQYVVIDRSDTFLGGIFSEKDFSDIDPAVISPDAMASELKRRYQADGYILATVKGPTIENPEADLYTYTYEVSPGKQFVISKIEFVGSTLYTQEELIDILDMGAIWNNVIVYDQDDLKERTANLKSRYLEAGYWDVEIREPAAPPFDLETGTVNITIIIDEGRQRILGDVEYVGINEDEEQEFRQRFPLALGQPYQKAKLLDYRDGMKAYLVEKGYLYTEARAEVLEIKEADRNKTKIRFIIKKGSRVRVGNISIDGLIRTRSKVVRRELLFSRGEVYVPSKIEKSRTALIGLGLFRSVRIRPDAQLTDNDKPVVLDLIVEVKEGRPGNVSFGPGWNLTKGWRYGADASYGNLSGLARKVSIRGEVSEEKDQHAIDRKTLVGRKVGLGFLEPYVGNFPVDASIGINHKATSNEKLWILSNAGEIALTHRFRRWFDDASITFYYGQKIAKNEGEIAVRDDLAADDVRIGFIGERFHWDNRDNKSFPTDGFYFETGAEWARYHLGGDLKYLKWHLIGNQYFDLPGAFVFALGAQTTSFENIERKGDIIDILPPSERLRLGGNETVRGYPPQNLGPIVRSPNTIANDSGEFWDCSYKDPLRLNGTRRVLVRGELRYRMSESLAMTGFVDSGNVFFSEQQMNVFRAAYKDQPVSTPTSLSDDESLNDIVRRCGAGFAAIRSVEDNVSYAYSDLLKKPGFLMSRHYSSYGLAFNLLTPLGFMSGGYGLPLREPTTAACAASDDFCYPAAKQSGHWIGRGRFHFSVGAKF